MAAASLLSGALAIAASAQAQPAPSSGPTLSWVRLPGAEPCIAQAELAARIEARLGRAVFVRPSDAIVLVEGRVAPLAAGGFEAVIALSDRDGHGFGERAVSLPSADCRQLDDVVALVIAVTLRGGPSGLPLPPSIARELEALFGDEPSVLDPSSLPPAAEPPATQAPARDQQERGAARPQRATAGPALAFGLDAGMTVVTGLQPSGSLAPAARLQISLRDLGTAALAGGIVLPQQMSVDDRTGGSDGKIELRAWYAALALCTSAARAFETTLELCGRFAYGRLHAEAKGFVVENHAQTQSWAELGPELVLQAPLIAPLRARIGVSLPIRVARPELVYQPHEGKPQTAFRVTGVGLAGELALGVTLP